MKMLTVIGRWWVGAVLLTLLSACGPDNDNSSPSTESFTVTASAENGGSISPATQTISNGETATFTVTANNGFAIGSVNGCNGEVSGNTYTTGEITENCAVTATFNPLYTVLPTVDGGGGSISPAGPQQVAAGETVAFILTANSGFVVDSVTGCGNGGNLSQDAYDRDSNTYTYTYTTAAIGANCSLTAEFTEFGGPITPTLSFAPVKLLRFNWTDVEGATHYRLLENPDGMSGFTPVEDENGEIVDIDPGVEVFDHQVPLYARINASYILQSCVDTLCYESGTVFVSGTLVNSIGYVKASNTGGGDGFGLSVSINGLGDTLAVGANGEDSDARGIDNGGDPNSNNAGASGAVYVFTRDDTSNIWSQQAYIKASNAGSGDQFGVTVSLDKTGDTLAVGAPFEDSGDRDNESDNNAGGSGAVYVFTRDDTTWSQQDYIKAGDIDEGDQFGTSLSLSGDGRTLAVGARFEDSAATGVNPPVEERDDDCDKAAGDQEKCAISSGAVYVFIRDDNAGQPWNQLAYIKASNAEGKGYIEDQGEVIECNNSQGTTCDFWGDEFGHSVSLNDTGDILAVGARFEDSDAAGVDNYINGMGDPDFYKGNASDLPGNNFQHSRYGAVYIFTRDGSNDWSEQAYVKARNPNPIYTPVSGLEFGYSISLNGAGDTLAVGGPYESADYTHLDTQEKSGAVFVFTRVGTTWSEQAYIKATHPGYYDFFGLSVSLSGSGDTLAVSTRGEDGTATGIHDEGNEDCTANSKPDSCALGSGAAYVFTRDDGTNWNQQAYIKAGNAEADDRFGWSVSLNDTGDTLAVGAILEDSAATGINGDQHDNDAENSGAVYLY